MDIALIGIGKIALDSHVPTINASPDWTLAATVSRSNAIPGITSYTDFSELLETRTDIRTVSLCMPPAPRFSYAAAAIKAGRHVMLEKPPGGTLSECYTLQAMAQHHDVSLYTTWHSREAAMVPAAKAWLATRTLRNMRVEWKEDVRKWHPGQDWIWNPGGMGMFDMGINGLSILTEIVAEPIHLKSAQLQVPENKQMPIAGSLDFFHPGGTDLSVELDWAHEGDESWSIRADTDDGQMLLSQGGDALEIDGQAVEPKAGTVRGVAGEYHRLYQKMTRLVRTGQSDFDISPMRHVADALAIGHRKTVAPFFD
ncbi:MAG: Gfo/Idh/MocA family protein [Hyphomicrobiales bacterium]